MKIKFLLPKQVLALAFCTVIITFSSCDSSKTEVSAAFFKAGKPIDATTTGGSVKGTMLTGTTYRITTDLIVNEGDTLVIQPGVKVYMGAADPAKNGGNSVTNLIVRGTLLSLGTKEKPIYFTVENQAKTDTPGAPATDANGVVDPAYKGIWGGILGDSKTKLMVIKWTHVEFGCGKLATSPVSGITSGNPAYMISFINPQGVFILEDSWVYGGVDDPIRLQGGMFNVMRNTFEKGGLFGGESLNVKHGCVGNYAYNVTVGSSTNGPKVSDKGAYSGAQANVLMYNNTIVNSGYRRDKPGRGGSLNFEENGKGLAFNNIVVNCKYGLRILTADKGSASQYSNNPLSPASFANITYGNNLYYVDNVAQANEIYPIESGTGIPTGANADIPNFTTLGIAITSTFPLSKSVVTTYDGTKAVKAAGTNPLFKTFTLPASGNPSDIAYATGFDFNLQSSSPAIGKGFTGFTPVNSLTYTDATSGAIITVNLPVSDNFGATVLTGPNKDLGAYPMDGSGNKH